MKLNLPANLLRNINRLVSYTILNNWMPIIIQRGVLNLLGGFAPIPNGLICKKIEMGLTKGRNFTPKETSDSVILYFHGGGYAIGSSRSHRDLCSHLSDYASAELISVDYRRAPENPYPTALEDFESAYQWLLGNYPEHKIILAGDSAGAGIVVNGLQKICGKVKNTPVALYLISPWLDIEKNYSHTDWKKSKDPLLKPQWLHRLAKLYMAGNKTANPLEQSFEQFPRTLIQAGEQEILLKDSQQLFAKLEADGVDVDLHIEEQLWHVHQFNPSLSKAARSSLERSADFIKALN
ncbi:alpha/beta hydrolase [Kangiella sp. HZ709]|uniref:alpha/beta hydrolase n=1 Tax=Kangiella sp. HZ709 TaxID=2666328 RepID=UPI0012B048F4|nr:alpha/beta hydrolase [Kangiella sp. HZ709]MRX28051.1 alpha/beta hydrolase fold domain-containing protein [Kangiella sp. HZ709]